MLAAALADGGCMMDSPAAQGRIFCENSKQEKGAVCPLLACGQFTPEDISERKNDWL